MLDATDCARIFCADEGVVPESVPVDATERFLESLASVVQSRPLRKCMAADVEELWQTDAQTWHARVMLMSTDQLDREIIHRLRQDRRLKGPKRSLPEEKDPSTGVVRQPIEPYDDWLIKQGRGTFQGFPTKYSDEDIKKVHYAGKERYNDKMGRTSCPGSRSDYITVANSYLSYKERWAE